MVESAFQFRNPSLVYLKFETNKDFQGQEDADSKAESRIEIKIEQKENASNEAEVSLTVELGKDEDFPFHVIAVEAADFKWDVKLEKKMVQRLLRQNAPALLLGYVRPLVAQITGASAYETFNIPFINFADQPDD